MEDKFFVKRGPGPAAYNPIFQTIQGQLTFRYTFAQRPNTSYSTISPGPGQYSLRSQFLERGGTAFPQSSRNNKIQKRNNKESSPGPGSYNSNNNTLLTSSPKYKYLINITLH